MNNSLDKALYYLTGNGNINAVKVEELEKLVNNHPYFPVAHFLLSKKFKNQNNPGFLPQVQKTALYFPNPYWLHYQLLNNLPDEPIIHDNTEPSLHDTFTNNKPEDIEDIDVEESIAQATSIEDAPVSSHTEHAITAVFTADELEAADKLAQQTLKEDANDEPILASHEDTAVVNEASASNELTEDEVEQHETAAPEQSPVEVEDLNSSDITSEHTTAINEEDATVEEETLPQINEQTFADKAQPVSHGHIETTTQAEEEGAVIARDTDEATTQFLHEVAEEAPQQSAADSNKNISAIEDARQPEDDEHEKMFQNIKAMLDASSDEANADVDSSVVPIDPYYTIDYFAAQGIKLDLEKNPQDKLGKQVKKFTQWLKHMKKIGPEDSITTDNPSPAEVEAQQTADASNVAREVVTEAMALVLEKQGKKDKAIQLYHKLTFINPHKSAYFAGKINHLNSL